MPQNQNSRTFGNVSVLTRPGARDALGAFEFLDRQSGNVRRVRDAGLRDLDDRFCNHFRQRVVAILDAKGMQRLLVCLMVSC